MLVDFTKIAEFQQAFLKAGLYGDPGTGKTRTAVELAIGIELAMGNKRPVAMQDTESGSDHVVPVFEARGVRLAPPLKSRAFSDAFQFLGECVGQVNVVIFDSVTHLWDELIEAFMRKHKTDVLMFHHWRPIKAEWKKFTELYLNSPVHVIVCGRAGGIWAMEEIEGRKQMVQTDTKMRAEGQFGYEPNLLIEMHKLPVEATAGKKRIKSGFVHRAVILKDRTDTMNGATVDNPRFEDFAPVWKFLHLGSGAHRVIDSSRTSDASLADKDWSSEERRRRVKIALESIDGELQFLFPGSTAGEKMVRSAVQWFVFETHSREAIERKSPDQLEQAAKIIPKVCRRIIEAQVELTRDSLQAWLPQAIQEVRDELDRPAASGAAAEADANPFDGGEPQLPGVATDRNGDPTLDVASLTDEGRQALYETLADQLAGDVAEAKLTECLKPILKRHKCRMSLDGLLNVEGTPSVTVLRVLQDLAVEVLGEDGIHQS